LVKALEGDQDEAAAPTCHCNGFDNFGRGDRPARPARAQTYDPSYPVCLQVYQSMVDYYFECHYRTMAQCAASASGRSAQCVVNPYYGGPNAGRGKKKRPQQY
jgi:hypothetical protein